jgi:hypothetical protein
MKLPPAFYKLSTIKHAKIIGVILTILTNIGILVLNAFFTSPYSMYIILICTVIVTFLFLYLFGIREGKWLAVIGIIIFLIIGAINGPLILHQYYSLAQPEPVESTVIIDWGTNQVTQLESGNYTMDGSWYYLANGTVTPYKDEVGSYRFSVTLYSNDTFTTQPDLRFTVQKYLYGDLGSQPMDEVEFTDTNYADGKEFAYDLIIQEEWIYLHWYGLVFDAGGSPSSLNTSLALGPLVGEESNLYPTFAGLGTVSMFCNVGMMFLIIVLLYWWLGTAKEKRKQWQESMREDDKKTDSDEDDDEAESADIADSDESEETTKSTVDSSEEEFTCTSCGAPVSAMHNFCPNCGERFDGIEEEEETKTGEEAENEGQ